MFQITIKVNQGIIFLRLYGFLNQKTIEQFSEEINYLLYEQGTMNFVINFLDVQIANNDVLVQISNKLTEIFLKCGEVVLCGLEKEKEKFIGKRKRGLFFVENEFDAFQYLTV